MGLAGAGGKGLSGRGQEQQDAIVYELDIQPRQRLSSKYPIEMMMQMMARNQDTSRICRASMLQGEPAIIRSFNGRGFIGLG